MYMGIKNGDRELGGSIHKSLSFTVTYDGNVVLLDNGLCLWHNARESAESGGTMYYKHYYGNKLFE